MLKNLINVPNVAPIELKLVQTVYAMINLLKMTEMVNVIPAIISARLVLQMPASVYHVQAIE